MIRDWKEDIRDVLLRVRQQMIEFIENFTERFIKQIGKIESDRRELATFVGEDRRQGERLSYIEAKLVTINSILQTVEDTQPNLKAKVVKESSEEMLGLENEVIKKN